MRALVTGGFGFIGSHLVDALLARGHGVAVIDNLATGNLRNLEHCRERIRFIEKDIRDLDACREAVDGCEVVFHLAALGSVPRSMADPVSTLQVNVMGTANVLTAARDGGVRRVVFASSSSVYGDSTVLPRREGAEGAPLSPYALSKQVGEQMAACYGRSYGLPCIGLRYFNVYGPRQDPEGPYAAVIPRFFAAYLGGRAPVINGDGLQTRDFTFVTDVARANILAADAPADAVGAVYNVGAGAATSIADLARRVRAACAGGPDPSHVPRRAGDPEHSVADTTRARERIGLPPATPLDAGLARCHEWYAGAARAAG